MRILPLTPGRKRSNFNPIFPLIYLIFSVSSHTVTSNLPKLPITFITALLQLAMIRSKKILIYILREFNNPTSTGFLELVSLCFYFLSLSELLYKIFWAFIIIILKKKKSGTEELHDWSKVSLQVSKSDWNKFTVSHLLFQKQDGFLRIYTHALWIKFPSNTHS